jgi:hypothetical protein
MYFIAAQEFTGVPKIQGEDVSIPVRLLNIGQKVQKHQLLPLKT